MSRVRIRFDDRGEVAQYALAPSDEQARRGLRAMALAPPGRLDVYEALLRGEQVPLEQLDPAGLTRHGLRRTA